MRNIHQGETAIICGIGPSLTALPDQDALRAKGITTIGVNDVFKHRPVDYLFMIDQPVVFKAPRIDTIVASTPRYWFMGTVAHASWNHERRQRKLHELSPVMNVDTGLLPGKRLTTPSLACGLALFLGFKRIGLIGVDIVGHKTLVKHVDAINVIFSEVLSAAWLAKAGLVNMSPMNALPILPQMTIPDFLAGKPVTHAPRRQKKHTQRIRYYEKGTAMQNDPRTGDVAAEVRS
jgi:hypothetical protein